ncbi:hypothetical protein [Halobaculum marinum]|uniref:Uncharacterized protein n=1 Tax=Halobaculum marinum TaxID=3031996 RepID=A0ABD5WZ90_9EURY|nr:hypothetical protein [Halobaculum sp. DT55]
MDSTPVNVASRHPRAVTTALLMVLLLLSADTAAAFEFGVGTHTVGDVSQGP